MEAVSSIEKQVSEQPEMWVLKTDIRHFFDEINHEKMLEILKECIKEPEVLNLIQMFLKVPALDENGELKSKECGIYQGATIAPLLSNIYLNEFDHQIREQTKFYYRYADDILCIDQEQKKVETAMTEMQQELKQLQLELHEKKTKICQVKQGFSYLGYEFSAGGKVIPARKQTELKERLEEMWFQDMEFEQKVQKGLEIINGWKQYFSGKRQAESIYELVLEIWCWKEKRESLSSSAVEKQEQLWEQRRRFTNMHADICDFFVELWTSLGREDAVLFEYEQLWQINYLDVGRCCSENSKAGESSRTGESNRAGENSRTDENYTVKELIRNYRKLQIALNKENLENIMQLYMDLRCYNKAAVFDEKIKELENSRHFDRDFDLHLSEQETAINFSLNEEEMELFHQLFTGREDIYAQETVNAYGKRIYEMVNEPLTLELLTRMYQQQISLATYVQRNNATARFMVFDLDISKKVLLKYTPETEAFSGYLKEVKEMACLLKKILLQTGLSCTVEFSGFRGYHIWIFFQEWISVRYIHMLQDIIIKKLEQELEKIPELQHLNSHQEILVELFPNHTRVNKDRAGQCIRIPFTRHIRTNQRTFFLDETGNPYPKQAEALQHAVQYPLSTIKRIIALSGSKSPKTYQQEDDIQILYPDLKPAVKIVLERCNLMKYLCRKAKTTGYLTHFERQTIMYVFAHLGDDGKAFVHQVMEQTLNYRFATTERFIQKLPAKPISCIKLREQYSQITAEIGCSCKFKRTKNCYPSPVLHAVKDNEEIQQDITLPLSRDVSQAKEKQIYEEINIHRKTQELAEKLLEYKKQKRGIDKNVRKLEDELTEIFNNAAVDCMEIEMGLLSRRRKEERYEWVIEL